MRAAAWDVEKDRRVQEIELNELEKMKLRQVQLGMGMQHAGMLELQAWSKKIARIDKAAETAGFVREPVLPTKDLVRLIEVGATLERVNRGEPTTIGRMEATGKDGGPINVRDLSQEERNQRIQHLMTILNASK